MLKKFFLGFIILIIICLCIVGYLYTQSEYRIEMHIAYKTYKLQTNMRKLFASQTCANEMTKPDCIVNFAKENGGVEYSTDFALLTIGAIRVCGSKDSGYCLFESYDKLIQLINIQNLWIKKQMQNPRSDDKAYAMMLKIEIGIIDKSLRAMRKKMNDQFLVETDTNKKKKLLEYIKNIDLKLLSIWQ